MRTSRFDLAGRVEAVARASDGRLFLAEGDSFDARTLFGAPFTDTRRLRQMWGIALERRLAYCRELGASLVVLIAPEAHGVHAEDLPEGMRYATPSVADAFAELARGMGAAVVFPRELLRAAGGPLDVFRRDDSHWTSWGAFVAYQALMDALPPALARGRVRPDEVSFEWVQAMGDLGWKGEDAVRRPMMKAVIDRPAPVTVLERSNERRHGLKITEAPHARDLPRAVIYRDSFGTELAPFLMQSFSRAVLVGSADHGHPDLIMEERPDVVILERSERSILTGLSDWTPETWADAFPEPGRDAAAHAAALSARGCLHFGDAVGAGEEAEAALEAEPTAQRRVVAGRARLALGKPQEARAVLGEAVEAGGGWTAVLHLGAACLADGDLGAARDLFARACAIAPWRPFGFEHFGYVSLALGDVGAAAAALRTAVRLSPESPGAHLLLVDALERQGDTEGARAALRAGRAALPHDPDLAALAGEAPTAPAEAEAAAAVH